MTILESYRTKQQANEGIAEIISKGGRIRQFQVSGYIWILADVPSNDDLKHTTKSKKNLETEEIFSSIAPVNGNDSKIKDK